MTTEVIDGKAFTAGLCVKLADAVAGLKAPCQVLAAGLREDDRGRLKRLTGEALPPVFAGGDTCHKPYQEILKAE